MPDTLRPPSVSVAMSEAFDRLSPRLNRRVAPLPSRLVTAFAVAAFTILLAQAFFRQGLAAWSVGLAYIFYDTCLLAFTAVHVARLGRPAPTPPPGPRPRLGVIIAARNEAAVLRATIDSLARQDEPPEQIILADDGSTDASGEELARVYGLAQPEQGGMSRASPVLASLRWLRLPHGGKARALNAAIPHLDTELMLTVDADTLLAPGALRAMRDAFASDPKLVAATGVLTPVCGKTPVARLFQWFQSYEYVRNFLSRRAWMNLNSLLLVSGAFAGFRRSAVIEVGGFDAGCMVEDYELIHRLHRHSVDAGRGWRVGVVGRALATTDAPASPMAFLRQRRRWFGGFLQTQNWNSDMVANPRFGWLGKAMMPVKALDTLQPIYGLAAFVVLLGFVVTGHLLVAAPVVMVMIAKVAIDLAFHLWSLGRYRAWTGQTEGLRAGPAILASFAEPFSFQLLRHAGAAWGWASFLTGRGTWGRQVRTSAVSEG